MMHRQSRNRLNCNLRGFDYVGMRLGKLHWLELNLMQEAMVERGFFWYCDIKMKAKMSVNVQLEGAGHLGTRDMGKSWGTQSFLCLSSHVTVSALSLLWSLSLVADSRLKYYLERRQLRAVMQIGIRESMGSGGMHMKLLRAV